MEVTTAKSKVRRQSGWVFKVNGQDHRIVWGIIYFDVDGRRRKERTDATTKMMARRILAERQNAVEQARLLKLSSVRDIVAPAEAVTLRAFSKEYMTHATAHLAKSTASTYQMCLDSHILSKLGRYTLREITAGTLQGYIDGRLAEKAKPSTVRQDLAIISGMYREAMKKELVDKNPARMVKKPRMDNEIVRFLDDAMQKELLKRTPEPIRSAILFAIHSGLRESEQTGLLWADVHWPIDTDHPETGHIVIRRTKSHRDRIVPMSATLHATLIALKARNGKYAYVFISTEAKKFERFNNTTWRNALKDSKITKFRWHDLRHTFGSRLAQRGIPITSIKELMGHSSVTVTMRYAHLAPSNLRDAVRALDRVVPKAKGPESATHSATRAGKIEIPEAS